MTFYEVDEDSVARIDRDGGIRQKLCQLAHEIHWKERNQRSDVVDGDDGSSSYEDEGLYCYVHIASNVRNNGSQRVNSTVPFGWQTDIDNRRCVHRASEVLGRIPHVATFGVAETPS